MNHYQLTKLSILALFSTLLFLSGCGDKEGQKQKYSSYPSGIDLNDRTPIATEKLLALVPEELEGHAKSYTKTGYATYENISAVTALYGKKNNPAFTLNITDGAGKSGYAVASVSLGRISHGKKIEERNDWKSELIEVNGNPAYTEVYPDSWKVVVAVKKRFIVSLGSNSMQIPELQKLLTDTAILDKLKAMAE